MEKVAFNYAFGAPHVITLSRPSGSRKTIVSAEKNHIDIKWTWQSLQDKYPLSWTIMKPDVTMRLTALIDGKHVEFKSWTRDKSGIPKLIIKGYSTKIRYKISGISGETGVVFKIECCNDDNADHTLIFNLEHTNGWVCSNRGWVDGVNTNLLVTGQEGRADRLIAYASGADHYPLISGGKNTITGVPMSDGVYEASNNPMKTLSMCFTLAVGDKKVGYFMHPYEMYMDDIKVLENFGYEKEIRRGVSEWKQLLNRGMQIDIPDKAVLFCCRSCLADIFVMREKLSGEYTGITAGTDVYRSVNSIEPASADMFLEQAGYVDEAVSDMRALFEAQDNSGCWVSSKCWEHDIWLGIFFKARLALNHYKISRDRKFLKDIYSRMKRSTLWNYKMRENNKHDICSASYGLMPRGMGDCGVMNNSDYFGYFYPHNCMAVAADEITLEAARILGEDKDIDQLQIIVDTAKADLIRSMRANSVKEEGYEWIPGTFEAAQTSFFGCLYAYEPCRILQKDDYLIQGTLKHVEKKKTSKGGLPLGMGWLKDGLWVAMALDNLSSAYLAMGEYEKAAAYLYPVLNHASPFVTWCEERGEEAGSMIKTGDLQHLWTPLSVCRYMRDSLIMEETDTLHICAGTPRQWLDEMGKIEVKNANTHFGTVDFFIIRKEKDILFKMKCNRERLSFVQVHIRLPLEKYKLTVTSARGCTAESEKEILQLKIESGICEVAAQINADWEIS